MVHRTRSLAVAGFLAALMLLFTAGIAGAQGMPVSCAAGINFCNLTGCQMTLILATTPANAIAPIVLGPGACQFVPTAGVTSINWVISGAGFYYPLVPPPPGPMPPTSCATTAWKVDCVRLPGATCCADICFNPATCTATINNSVCTGVCCRP